MLPLLTAPWALAALAALPALAALYWLRNTWRELPVSSLMFWMHQSESQASGLRMRRLQTPLLFFLEMAALLLLALAATGPRIDTAQGRWPLVVVLDDSYSMQAGGEESPRRLALVALERELRWGDDHPVRFVLAGETTQALGDSVWSWPEANEALAGWRCLAPTARLPEAAALAGELSGDKARILVVSDHGPEHDPGEARLQWWAFGQPRPNFAFVNAARSTRDGVDRCLLEIANFAPVSKSTLLVVTTGTGGQEIHRELLSLDAQEIRRVSLRLPNDLAIVRARLDDDALAIDNDVVLVREETPPVRVEVKLRSEALRVQVEKALQATGKSAPPGERPQLLVTDDADTQPPSAETWLVQFLSEKDAEAYIGPFVLDRTHPLTEGLALNGIAWGAGKTSELPGAPIILAGSVPIITDVENSGGQHQVRIRLRPDLSTLLETPAWPILMWNLVHWRAAELPGLRRANLRLGESAFLTVPLGVESILHMPPEGSPNSLIVTAQRAMVRPEATGLHGLEARGVKYQFAVNALRREESDLQTCVTGRWGVWHEDPGTAPALVHLAWIPMLLVLGVLTLHMALATRMGK